MGQGGLGPPHLPRHCGRRAGSTLPGAPSTAAGLAARARSGDCSTRDAPGDFTGSAWRIDQPPPGDYAGGSSFFSWSLGTCLVVRGPPPCTARRPSRARCLRRRRKGPVPPRPPPGAYCRCTPARRLPFPPHTAVRRRCIRCRTAAPPRHDLPRDPPPPAPLRLALNRSRQLSAAAIGSPESCGSGLAAEMHEAARAARDVVPFVAPRPTPTPTPTPTHFTGAPPD